MVFTVLYLLWSNVWSIWVPGISDQRGAPMLSRGAAPIGVMEQAVWEVVTGGPVEGRSRNVSAWGTNYICMETVKFIKIERVTFIKIWKTKSNKRLKKAHGGRRLRSLCAAVLWVTEDDDIECEYIYI